MKSLAAGAAAVAIALLTFFWFPGHTWLQQDTQIYAPILEHMRDPAVLRNDVLAQQPHVAFTLYDEATLLLRNTTGLGFRQVLFFQQIATRALGIWGLWLMAASLGLDAGPALLVTALCSLGAAIAGPSVLTFEYEPTPRAFAVPLLMCAVGLAADRRYVASGVAGAAAFLYHPPTALAFWVVFLAILAVRRKPWGAAPLAAAIAILAIAARAQGGAGAAPIMFARLDPMDEQVQRFRAAYVWISTWPLSTIEHHLIVFAVALAAFWRIRQAMPAGLKLLLLGMASLGMASMPVSWLLLEHWKWALVPQVQPLRMLLFTTLAMQFLAAAAGVLAARRGRVWEAVVWLAAACVPPVQAVATEAFPLRRATVIVALGAVAALAAWRAPRLSPAAALAAFFAIPTLAGVVNYPHLHTAELAQLSDWARSSTPRDAVFLFADTRRSLDPGIFRAEALRAVYVDWKGGGQVNYLKGFAAEWWFRWQQTLGAGFRPGDLPKYDGLGITFVVVEPRNRLPLPAAFENRKYLAYAVGPRVQLP